MGESSARRASSAEACCDLCQQAEGCVGWTWVPSSGDECWLKDQVGDLREDGSVTSGSLSNLPPSPAPSPSPSGCPGGSLDACIDLCPGDDAELFKACVKSCQRRCESLDIIV